MKTLTALRRAGYSKEAKIAKRTRVRTIRHDWRIALTQGREPIPSARWLASWGM